MLAKRLRRAGLAVSGTALAGTLAQHAASACVPAPLVVSTVSAAARVAAAKAITTAVVSGKVAALVHGALKGMAMQNIKLPTTILLAMALAIVGGGGLAYC